MNAKLCKALRAAARSMSPTVERVYTRKPNGRTICLYDCRQAAYKYLKRQARLSGAKS